MILVDMGYYNLSAQAISLNPKAYFFPGFPNTEKNI